MSSAPTGTPAPTDLATPAPPLTDSWPRRHRTLDRFIDALGEPTVTDFAGLSRFALSEPARLWTAILEFFDVEVRGSLTPAIIESSRPPYARFFPDATVNYAREILRPRPGVDAGGPAVIGLTETGERTVWTHDELRERVGALRAGLVELGVTRGDVVVAVLPNRPDALLGVLAAASLGAIWSSCGADLSPAACVERLAPLAPKVLLVADSRTSGGVHTDLTPHGAEVLAGLPDVTTVLVSGPGAAATATALDAVGPAAARPLDDLLADHLGTAPGFDDLPFEHPLWVLHTSGTTGPSKGIVHGHGGILLEHLKMLNLQNDIGPGDRVIWHTSVGWMLWNILVSGLSTGGVLYLAEGSPVYPDMDAPWRLVEQEKLTFLGTVSPLLNFSALTGARPRDHHDTSSLRIVATSGSTLNADAARWVYEDVGAAVVPLSMSGGTDICSAFLQPDPGGRVLADAIAAGALGVDAIVVDDTGAPVRDRIGELVVRFPIPAMPLRLWGDDDGERYRESYYDQFPGRWCHGDAVTHRSDGGYVMHGRSDATLNRGGVRTGTAEYYRVIEAIDGIDDSLVVAVPASLIGATESAEEAVVAFIVVGSHVSPREAAALPARVGEAVATEISPAHVPDRVVRVPAVPRTVTNKKCEVPIRRILRGADPAEVVNRESLVDGGAVDFFVDWAAGRNR